MVLETIHNKLKLSTLELQTPILQLHSIQLSSFLKLTRIQLIEDKPEIHGNINLYTQT